MCETLLSILCHLLEGENQIRERLEMEEKGETTTAPTGATATALASTSQPRVNETMVQMVRLISFALPLGRAILIILT